MKTTCLLTTLLLIGGFTAQAKSPWKKVWTENFSGNKLNTQVWKRTDRGAADWMNTQSKDPRCLTFRKGCLVLRGIVNDDLQADTAHYLTGGVVTKDLKPFEPECRIEIRARLHKAQGAWPAFWLLPFDERNNPWPHGGEIDIMERLNGDSIFHQTVHSKYTYIDHHGDNPKQSATAPIDPDGFNVYGVDILLDSICFHVNGKHTFTYPRVPELESQGQFPFIKPQYLLLDMQLGGSWVGEVKAEDLPVEMEIDWVKYYRKKE